MTRRDLLPATILLVFGLGVAIESWRMPRFESIGGTLANSPGLVPGILGIVIAALSAIMLVRALRGQTPTPAASEEISRTGDDHTDDDTSQANLDSAPPLPAQGSFEKPSNTRAIVTLVLSVAFAGFLIGRMPFWLATFLFVFTSIVYNEHAALKCRGRATKMLIIAFAIAGATGFAVPFVFEKVFLVTLP